MSQIVKTPTTYKEYINSHYLDIKQLVSDKIKEALKNFSSSIFTKLKVYLALWIVSFIVATGLATLSFFVAAFVATNNRIGAAICFGFATFFVILGLIMLLLWSKLRKKLKQAYLEQLNKINLFNLALNKLNYRIVTEPDEINKLIDKLGGYKPIKEWGYKSVGVAGIPTDADVSAIGPRTIVFDEHENSWHLQTYTFHWQREYKDKDGNVHYKDYYKQLGLLDGIYKKDLDDSNNLVIAMGTRSAYSHSLKANIELENKKFNKAFRPYCNDQIKARMIYTPLSMETLLAHAEQFYLPDFGFVYHDKKMNAWFDPSGNFMGIDLPSNLGNPDKVIKAVTDDIIKDTYSAYWVFSFATTPPYFC